MHETQKQNPRGKASVFACSGLGENPTSGFFQDMEVLIIFIIRE